MKKTPKPRHICCGLSKRTLNDHKRYGRPLGKPAALLLDHVENGRILPHAGNWQGVRVSECGEYLLCANGTQISPGEIEQAVWVRQMLTGAHNDLRRARERIQALEERLEHGTLAANAGSYHH